MEENTINVTERNFTIEDLHRKKAEYEALEKRNLEITAELQEEIERD